uniref:FUN14 domain containing 1 n=1 Tax=Cyprinus carpio carpio TaxID=630221 RepID=A0A8C1HAK2_CYPCA
MADRGEDVDAEREDEFFEVVNITDYARRHQWWSRVFGNSTGPIAEKYSVASQIMMGGVTGWCAGYLFQRVGKVVATAVGGGFLLLQILPTKIQALYPKYCFLILTAPIHCRETSDVMLNFSKYVPMIVSQTHWMVRGLPTTVAMCRLTGGKWKRMSIKLKSI